MLSYYHCTPASRYSEILRFGLQPRPVPYSTMMSPNKSVLYLMNSEETAKAYANSAYKHRLSNAKAWIIFRVNYSKDVYPDYDWGLPGMYYVSENIPPQNLEYVGSFNITPIYGMKRDPR